MPRVYAASPDGTQIRYKRVGNASISLVFVHGLSCSMHFWHHQIEYFRDRYTCFAVDLAGHGESGAGRTSWTVEAFAEDVAAVVRHLDRQTILIGHSLGGPVCAEAALRLRGNVIGVIGAESFHWFGTGLTPERIRQFIQPYERDYAATVEAAVRDGFTGDADPAVVAWVIEQMLSVPAATAISALEKFLTWHLDRGERALQALDVPACTINSGVLYRDVSNGLRRLGLSVTFIEEAGHFPMLEKPESCNRLLEREIEVLLTSKGLKVRGT